MARREGDAVQQHVAEAADETVSVAEGERVPDHRPGDRHHSQRADAHHVGVERVLRAYQPGVEEPERGRHHQYERCRDEHPRRVTGVDLRSERRHGLTGVTAALSVSPVLIRTTRSSATTKIFPSPTSPVCAPSHTASIVGCTNSSETATSNLTFSASSILT